MLDGSALGFRRFPSLSNLIVLFLPVVAVSGSLCAIGATAIAYGPWLRYKLRQLRPGPPSPISRLPPEILGRIFQFVPTHWDLPEESKRRLHARRRYYRPTGSQLATRFFVLSQVCTKWRDTAIATPELWKDILTIPLSDARRSYGSVIFMLEPYTAIEPDVYLDFHYSYEPYTPATIALVERCISMIPTLKSFELQGYGSFLLLDRPQLPAPELQRLNLVGSQHTPIRTIPNTLFNGHAPELRELRLKFMSIDLSSPLLSRLEVLEISSSHSSTPPTQPLDRWLFALSNMPRLKKVFLHYVIKPTPLDVNGQLSVTAHLPDLSLMFAYFYPSREAHEAVIRMREHIVAPSNAHIETHIE